MDLNRLLSDPNLQYPDFALNPVPVAIDKTTGKPTWALPNIVRSPANALMAIARGEKFWQPGAAHGSDVANLALLLAGGATSPRGLPVESEPMLYSAPALPPKVVVDNTPQPNPMAWNPVTNQPRYLDGRPTYDPTTGYVDPLVPQRPSIVLGEGNKNVTVNPPAETPSNVVPFPNAKAPPANAPQVQINTEPPTSWQPPADVADRPFANDPSMTWQEYRARLQSPDGGLTPPYDELFQNGKPDNLRYAGVYRNERLEDVLDQLQHNFPDRLMYEDLHGGSLGDAVSRRMQANLQGRTPNGPFQPTHSISVGDGGSSFSVRLTGNEHPQMGLTEVELQNGQKAWFPQERISEIQPPTE